MFESVSNMLKFLLVAAFMLCNVLYVFCNSEPMMGPGDYKIFHISFKEGKLNEIIIDLHQTMLDRDTYVYNGEIICDVPLDDGLGLKMDVCQYVDGGCKQYLVMTESSFISFVNNYAENNIKECFEKMGIQPAKMPLAQGRYEVQDMVFNTNHLPKEFPYGRYSCELCTLKGNLENGCILCEFEFTPKTSEEEDE